MLFLSTTAFVHTLTFLHLIARLKATTNLNKVAIYSECKTNVAREESLHSIFLDQSYQDIVKGLDSLEVLKICCWFPCLKVDADVLEQNVILQCCCTTLLDRNLSFLVAFLQWIKPMMKSTTVLELSLLSHFRDPVVPATKP